jgi:3-phenylpropionate/trans-cinnamate dioxygenase ferredoxin subunit
VIVDVGSAEDFPVDRPVVVSVDGREIAVVRRSAGDVYAIRNVCPHQMAALATGWVTPGLRSEIPGEMGFDDDVPVLHCPRHSWGYRLTDGASTADPSLRIRTFSTTCKNGRVLVDLGRR